MLGRLAIPLEHMIAVLAVAPVAEPVLMPPVRAAVGRWGTGRVDATGAAAAVATVIIVLAAVRPMPGATRAPDHPSGHPNRKTPAAAVDIRPQKC
ncbi:negative regulator of sigma E activity [Phytomonospora endophytica]|uniref:Negative regulator of sigma E activity n=1 Tax=Phytomonospora endophytica TaxID=714109 RepID=A0A841F8T7_9ACTN|nr:negative regulator of sigma E activity [Phytomonospora endophytica]